MYKTGRMWRNIFRYRRIAAASIHRNRLQCTCRLPVRCVRYWMTSFRCGVNERTARYLNRHNWWSREFCVDDGITNSSDDDFSSYIKYSLFSVSYRRRNSTSNRRVLSGWEIHRWRERPRLWTSVRRLSIAPYSLMDEALKRKTGNVFDTRRRHTKPDSWQLQPSRWSRSNTVVEDFSYALDALAVGRPRDRIYLADKSLCRKSRPSLLLRWVLNSIQTREREREISSEFAVVV